MIPLRLVLGIALAWSVAAPLTAHEVDQYDIPEDTELVDQGEMWDQMLYGAVQRAVEKTNAAIDGTPHVPGLREARLAQLQSPSALTWAVRHQLPNVVMAIVSTELKLHSQPKPKDPKRLNIYYSSPFSGVYSKIPYWPDPRQLNRISILRSSTIKVHGQYIGVDKISHFTGMGGFYYSYYQCARLAGKSQEEAISTARAVGQYGPISETWLVGGLPTGIYSNADMAANYVGLKYYINVTEPVTIGGKMRPPMVVRDGERWKIQPHVRPEFFAEFISPHFDEVLNPCLYEWTFRDRIRDAVYERRKAVVARYANEIPAARSPEYFDKVLKECLTYHGEEYGHSGQVDKLLTVSSVCFDAPAVDGLPSKEIQLASLNSPLSGVLGEPEKLAQPRLRRDFDVVQAANWVPVSTRPKPPTAKPSGSAAQLRRPDKSKPQNAAAPREPAKLMADRIKALGP